jgi:SNF2 family DNA or RNA helicase
MKEDVLSDLPPKITQDYVCDLSPLQIQLYEDFARSRVRMKVFWAFLIGLVRVRYLPSIVLAVKYVERDYLLFCSN